MGQHPLQLLQAVLDGVPPLVLGRVEGRLPPLSGGCAVISVLVILLPLLRGSRSAGSFRRLGLHLSGGVAREDVEGLALLRGVPGPGADGAVERRLRGDKAGARIGRLGSIDTQ